VDLPHLQHVLEILQNQQQHDIQDELEAFLQGDSGSDTHQNHSCRWLVKVMTKSSEKSHHSKS
jgi:hypothetical protein